MAEPDVTRSKATARSSDWLRGALGIFASAVAAAVIGSEALSARGAPWAVAAVAGALAVGAVWAGRQVGAPHSERRFVACMLMPVPTVLVAFVLMELWTEFGAQSEVNLYTGGLLLLSEIPLGVTLVLLTAIEQRHQPAPGRRPAPPPLDRQLAAATRNGQSATVIREYIDNEEGEALLEADEVALLDHGYGLISIDMNPPPDGLRADVGKLYDVLAIFSWTLPSRGEGANDGRIIATFRREQAGRP